MTKSLSIIGCGWLGLPTAEHFLQKEKNYSVKGSTTTPSKLSQLEEKGIQAYLLQLQNDGSLPESQSRCLKELLEVETLIINIPPGRRNPNIEAAFAAKMNTLITAIQASPLRQILFISSTSVYPKNNTLVTEADALSPTKASGRALLEAEQALQALEGLKVSVLRLSGLYGPNRPPGRFLAGKQNLTNGEGRINLVHQQDCIEVIAKVIGGEKWGEVYNVCADEHPTRRDFYTVAAKKLDLPPPTFAPNSPAHYCIVSNEKAKRELGHEFIELGTYPSIL